jgi:hypothetical protein
MRVRIKATLSASWLWAEAFSPRALAQILQNPRRLPIITQMGFEPTSPCLASKYRVRN